MIDNLSGFSRFVAKKPTFARKKPTFKNKSGHEKKGPFSQNGAKRAVLGPFWAIYADLTCEKCQKAHLPTFSLYLLTSESL